MAIKKFKPTSPGRRHMTSSNFEEVTTSIPEKSLARASEEERRAEQLWADHQASYRGRAQAQVPDYRFQEGQERDSRPVIVSVEYDPEPLRPYRAAQLCRRRKALYSGPGRTERRATRSLPASRRISSPETPCRSGRFPSAPGFTMSSSRSARAGRWPAVPAPMP